MYYNLLLYLLLCIIFIYVHSLCSALLLMSLYMYVCKPFAHTQLSSHLNIDFLSAISIPQDGYLTIYFNNG